MFKQQTNWVIIKLKPDRFVNEWFTQLKNVWMQYFSARVSGKVVKESLRTFVFSVENKLKSCTMLHIYNVI